MSEPAAGNGPAPADVRRLSGTDVRQILGEPEQPVRDKIDTELGDTARRFIAHAPFVALATAGPDGADCSPRGDGPGFVRVHDPSTLTLPDRTGNNLADSFRNVLADPRIGLLFLIPGMRETLRVNGTAFVTDDDALRLRHAADGRVPRLVLVVRVRENYFHCGKALIRSGLWDRSTWIDPANVVFASNVFSLRADERAGPATGPAITSADLSRALEESYVTQL